MPKHKKKHKLDLQIDVFIESNALMLDYSDAIRFGISIHRNPYSLLRALSTLQYIGLFEEEIAGKTNFKKTIQHLFPECLADIMMIMHSILPMELGDKVKITLQYYFDCLTKVQHPFFKEKVTRGVVAVRGLSDDEQYFWLNYTIAFRDLYLSSDLLIGKEAISNSYRLLTPNVIFYNKTIGLILSYTKLLTETAAQEHFNLLLSHKKPELLCEALSLLIEGTRLFDDELAETNYKALLSIVGLQKILPTLQEQVDKDLIPAQMQSAFTSIVRPYLPKKRTADTRKPRFFEHLASIPEEIKEGMSSSASPD